MNVWKWIAVTCTAGSVAVILNCGGSTAPATSPGGGGQPNMQAARGELQAARNELDQAEPNKGGHRERAIELTDKAIHEVDQGIAYAE